MKTTRFSGVLAKLHFENSEMYYLCGESLICCCGQIVYMDTDPYFSFFKDEQLYFIDDKEILFKLSSNDKSLKVSNVSDFDVSVVDGIYDGDERYYYDYFPTFYNKEFWKVYDSNDNKWWSFKSKKRAYPYGEYLFELDSKCSISLVEFGQGLKWSFNFHKESAPKRKFIDIYQNKIIFYLGTDKSPSGNPLATKLNGTIVQLNLEDGSENWYYEFFHCIQDFYVHKDIIYVAHRNEIAALNAESGELIRETQAGENYGNNIVWCDGDHAYLFNYGDEKAYIFDLELKQQLGTLVFPNNFILNNQHHPYLIGDEIFIPVCPKRLNMAHAEQGVIRINRTKVLNDDVLEYVNEPEFTRATINNPDGTQSYQLSLKGDNADSVIRIGEVELRKIYAELGTHFFDGIDTRNSQFNAVVYIDMQIQESELGRFNELFETLKKRMEDWLYFMRATDNTGKLPAKVNYTVQTF
ncbi:hypothetical protein [Algibacillus agarilyticus]|uniref:hypothetical protein n=1 Tax=Algibacillus agarilyticus TaxID=2234133 RepID=UPI001300B30B|nr:hypothetical protein [Algibacillus agarilyticus]